MRFTVLFLFIGIFSVIQPAYALRVRNTDTTAHELTTRYLNDSWDITLEPGGTLNRATPGLVLQMAGQQPIRTQPDEEYAIRKGRLVLQRRNCCGRGNR